MGEIVTDQRVYPKLRVVIIGQQNSFGYVLATNIQCWGYEVVMLSVTEVMGASDKAGRSSGGKMSQIEADVLLYDLDEALPVSALVNRHTRVPIGTSAYIPLTVEAIKRYAEQCSHRYLTIALSSLSVSRTMLEQLGAVAFLQKPFEMSWLQRYLRVFQQLLLDREAGQQLGEKIRIVVADDDAEMVGMIREALLAEMKYDVAVAYDGLEALEKCLNWHPHCMVTDLIMPWMNGYQVMRCLATHPFYTMPALIIMSALHGLEVPVHLSWEQGKAVRYLSKPFDVNNLLVAIEQVVYSEHVW